MKTSQEVLTKEKINVALDLDGLVITLDDNPIKIKYSTMTVTEALLLRLAFANSNTVTYPGVDTSKLLKDLKNKVPTVAPNGSQTAILD